MEANNSLPRSSFASVSTAASNIGKAASDSGQWIGNMQKQAGTGGLISATAISVPVVGAQAAYYGVKGVVGLAAEGVQGAVDVAPTIGKVAGMGLSAAAGGVTDAYGAVMDVCTSTSCSSYYGEGLASRQKCNFCGQKSDEWAGGRRRTKNIIVHTI